jgi:polar amino acid transport system substrate-binding protein
MCFLRALLSCFCLLTTGMLVAQAQKAPQPDPRIADVVQAGKIRFALFQPGYTTSASGEVRGAGTGAAAVEIIRALAKRLGVEVVLVGNPTPAGVVQCLTAGTCDMAYMGLDPTRAGQLEFTPPFMQQDFTYLVPAGSAIRSVADADRPGVRIAIVRGHVATLALSRIMKNAETVAFDIPSDALEAVRLGRADTWASARFGLLESATKLTGSRVLEDRYGANLVAMAVPKGQTGRLAYVSEFIEEAKASGLVQRAIESAKLQGYQVVLSK